MSTGHAHGSSMPRKLAIATIPLSLLVLAIEELAVQIENPFGGDAGIPFPHAQVYSYAFLPVFEALKSGTPTSKL